MVELGAYRCNKRVHAMRPYSLILIDKIACIRQSSVG